MQAELGIDLAHGLQVPEFTILLARVKFPVIKTREICLTTSIPARTYPKVEKAGMIFQIG